MEWKFEEGDRVIKRHLKIKELYYHGTVIARYKKFDYFSYTDPESWIYNELYLVEWDDGQRQKELMPHGLHHEDEELLVRMRINMVDFMRGIVYDKKIEMSNRLYNYYLETVGFIEEHMCNIQDKFIEENQE